MSKSRPTGMRQRGRAQNALHSPARRLKVHVKIHLRQPRLSKPHRLFTLSHYGTYDTVKGWRSYVPYVVERISVRAELDDDHHRHDMCIFRNTNTQLPNESC